MWERVLDRAGIREPEARREYTAQRRAVRRFAPAEYLAARLLLPARLQPDVVALVAFMHETDDRIDRGDRLEREEALRRWRELTREALTAGSSQPVLQVLAWTVRRHPLLHGRVEAFLDGAAREVAWERFGSEAEVGQYIEEYSLPALMLSMGLLAPERARTAVEFEQACLALITAMQRLDFLEDLAQDVREGRVGISQEALARHGLTTEDLRPQAAGGAPVAELIAAQTAAAAVSLGAAQPIVGLAAAAYRPFLRAVLRVQEIRSTAVRKAGASLVVRSCGPSPVRCGGVVLREILVRAYGGLAGRLRGRG